MYIFREYGIDCESIQTDRDFFESCLYVAGTGYQAFLFTSRVYYTNPFPMGVDIHVVTLAECDLSDSCHTPILSVISWRPSSENLR